MRSNARLAGNVELTRVADTTPSEETALARSAGNNFVEFTLLPAVSCPKSHVSSRVAGQPVGVGGTYCSHVGWRHCGSMNVWMDASMVGTISTDVAAVAAACAQAWAIAWAWARASAHAAANAAARTLTSAVAVALASAWARANAQA